MSTFSWLWRSCAALLALVAAIGLLHLPSARPWLNRAGGCPIPRATAAQVEVAQAAAFGKLRGHGPAKERPALGFGLEIAARVDVEAWAARHRISCEARRDGAVLLCDAVPASAVSSGGSGRYDELAFGFRLRDLRLVNVTALRSRLTPEEAGRELRRIALRLEDALGAPATEGVAGDPAVVVHRHANYLAEVSAMSLRGRGHVLREHYMSAPE
jgi:hypothetical protein